MTLGLQTLHSFLSSKLTYHLLAMELFILGTYQQISNKAIKNQGESKNSSNEFHDFIHCIANLIGPLYIWSFSNISGHE